MGYDPQHSGLSLGRQVPVINRNVAEMASVPIYLIWQAILRFNRNVSSRNGDCLHYLLKLEAVGKFYLENIVRMDAE
jgi:hypothetical protein